MSVERVMVDGPRLEIDGPPWSQRFAKMGTVRIALDDVRLANEEAEAVAVLARCIREGRQFAYDPVEGPTAHYCVDDEFAPSAAEAYSRALSAEEPADE